MIGPWLEIGIEVKVLTPMHIGSGSIGFSHDVMNEKTRKPVEIGMVVADVDDNPVVPGSSLKGAARALLAGHPAEEALFGPRSIVEHGVAKAGRLTFYTGCVAEGSIPDLPKAPFASATLAVDPDEGGAERRSNKTHGQVGLFVDSRTAINSTTGVAHAGRLFHKQFVAPGVRFKVTLGLSMPDDRTEAGLAELIRRLTRGFALGAGTGSDQGRLAVVPESLRATDYRLDRVHALAARDVSDSWRARCRPAPPAYPCPDVEAVTLRFSCRGAFLVNDASAGRRREVQRSTMDEPDAPHLDGLRGFGDHHDLPRLPGTSLRGALRARAVWLKRLEMETSDACEDNRDRLFEGDADALSASERLFGVNGWRSLLLIRDLACEGHDGWQDLTSVRLDGFSGAPVDGGLFSLSASVNPVFSATLAVTRRGGEPRGDDLGLFRSLLADLKANGIRLGHGTNRGFGWFSVEERG